MTTQELIGEMIVAGKGALTRFLAGFTEANRTTQAPHLPNHVIWTLGHVSTYLHEAAKLIDGQPMPERDFGPDTGRGNTRFAVDSIGFASKPVNEPAQYPSLARGVAIFTSACDRLATAVRNADNATLEKKVEWMGTPVPLGLLAARVMHHVGMHTGQIMDLRRAIGLEPVLK